MANEHDGFGARAWRNKASYAYALSLPREKFAAEFMRRNATFEATWRVWLSRQSPDDVAAPIKPQRLEEPDPEAEGWGLLAFPFRGNNNGFHGPGLPLAA